MTKHIDITKITLKSGSHAAAKVKDPEVAEGCVMEWVSVFAHERWSEIQIWGWRRRMMRAIKKRPPVRADAASHSAARHRHERP